MTERAAESNSLESSSTSMEHVLLLSGGFSTQEKLRACCMPRYKMRRIKNKGATAVLVLCYLMISALYLLISVSDHDLPHPQAWLMTFGITTSLAGWLADAFIGRYKVIRCSILMTWLFMIIAAVSSVIAQLEDRYYKYNAKILLVIFSLMSIGIGGFQANIIQFGLDQLHDASTTEITSFIIWYVCTLFSAIIVVTINYLCLNEQYKLFIHLFTCANLTLAVLLLFCCNHWLVKEPAAQNPFKLVYKVIKYAIKTKHPRHRSAFTYCEDDLPSRIDFGKSKYGGPFTTEQVEDVKTFLRLLPLIIVSGIVAGVTVPTFFLSTSLSLQYTTLGESNMEKVLSNCYSQVSMTHVAYFSGTVLIALHELFICPVFNRCCPRIKSLRKIVIGVVLQIVWVTTLMAFDVLSRHLYLKSNGYNATIQCIFYESHSTLSTSFSYHWLAIPNFLQFTSIVFCLIGIIEFISAQVPYSMKGLTIGLLYSLAMFFATAIGLPSLLLFKHKLSTWGTGTISCGFWYALLVIVVELFICAALLLFMRWYKNRKREDVLPNEHFFAERYYSKNTM